MKILAVVPRGLEPVVCLDVKELLGLSADQGDGWVSFSVKRVEDALRFAYRAQSVSRVMIVAAESSASHPSQPVDESLPALISSTDWSSYLPQGLSFAARAVKLSDEDLPSPDIAAVVGGSIKDKTGAKVDLNDPDVLVSAVIGADILCVGLDVAGDDLAKHPYRLFPQGQAIKAPLAYAVVRETGWTEKKSLLDPFCQAGTVPIEAALWASKVSPNKFAKERLFFTKSKWFSSDGPGSCDVKALLEEEDAKAVEQPLSITAMDESFRSISSAKRNAKLAGVEKRITFSKLDVEWLDVKFGKGGLDCIAAFPPLPNRITSQAALDKVYKEFLYQADYILRKNGRLSMLVKSLTPWVKPMEAHGFKIATKRAVFQGKEALILVSLERV